MCSRVIKIARLLLLTINCEELLIESKRMNETRAKLQRQYKRYKDGLVIYRIILELWELDTRTCVALIVPFVLLSQNIFKCTRNYE